jgi:hypothetical protein
MVDTKSKSGNDKEFVHGYVGEIALDDASTTEQIPLVSYVVDTPEVSARQRRACALSGHGCHHAA